MFKKKKSPEDRRPADKSPADRSPGNLAPLEGVVTFFSSHHALRAENVMRKNGYRAVLIPGPREISPNCGVALRFDYAKKEEVMNLFSQSFVHYEDIHHYPEKGSAKQT